MVYCLVVTFNAHGFAKHEYYYASRDACYIGNFSRNFTRQTKRMQKVSENDKLMFIQMRNLISNDQCLCSNMLSGEEKRERHLEPTSLKFAICLIESFYLQDSS